MTDQDRCEPPPEHLHHRWHWVSFEWDTPRPAEFDDLHGWWLPGGAMKPSLAWRLGWRYVAPCLEPGAEKKGIGSDQFRAGADAMRKLAAKTCLSMRLTKDAPTKNPTDLSYDVSYDLACDHCCDAILDLVISVDPG